MTHPGGGKQDFDGFWITIGQRKAQRMTADLPNDHHVVLVNFTISPTLQCY